MTKTASILRYSQQAHGQPNANASDANRRTEWSNHQKASSSNGTVQPSGSATATFGWKALNKKKPNVFSQTKPWTFAGNNYNLNLPACAYITNITFTARIKISGTVTVNAPYARFNIYNGTNNVSDNVKNHTGWSGGYYYYNPNKKLSNSWQNITYVMSGAEFRKRGYPVSSLNAAIMGIDLIWDYPTKQKDTHTVSVQYISVKVDYELPDQKLIPKISTNGDNPVLVKVGEWSKLELNYKNQSNASCCNGNTKKVTIEYPPNTLVETNELNTGYFDGKTWNVSCTPNANATVIAEYKPYTNGLQKIHISNPEIGDLDYWFYALPNELDVGELGVYPQVMQQGVKSCIEYHAKVNSHDGIANFQVSVGDIFEETPKVDWSIDYERTSPEVQIIDYGDDWIDIQVPKDTITDIVFRSCFIPTNSGKTRAELWLDEDMNDAPYEILPAPIFKVTNNPKDDDSDRTIAEISLSPSLQYFKTHRIASSTELGAYVIDCGIAPFDKTMVENECTLTADNWEPIDYIGVIPLEYHHYDPESTYSNKGISNSYKNKTYKGKEGVIDEKISLKFKIRPKQSPTLQGMVKLDKPTPINANHKCFEGDPLNHRGWAVLSDAKIVRTNPLWYDVEADVDYITHDIHTKFQIFKELTVNTHQMPDLTAEVFGLGESLSSGLDVFSVDTDGGYLFDDEGEEGTRNLFSLDEGQHLHIKTLESLSDVSLIRFDWYSNSINETRENNIERVFRILDENGESLFEYEYTNLQFYDDYVTCEVILRVKTSEGWDTYNYPDIDLRTEVEADPIIESSVIEVYDDEDSLLDDTGGVVDSSGSYDDTVEDDEYNPTDEDNGYYNDNGEFISYDDDSDDPEDVWDSDSIAESFDISKYNVTKIYGSSLNIKINGNTLQILDEGYNGREFSSENITLLTGKYYFETEWINRNHDGNTEDVISYMDLSLAKTLLNTDYAEYYKNIMVSPFPIPYKKVLFTRKSEEGTIYYLTGEEPFKYLLEPYYQYHCGCDLLGEETSIFDLNNSYTHYYIENGLVRLGFNKYNGRLYLAKYDFISNEWITTHYFHLVNEPKFAVDSLSDDKIVIKAGNDTFFTIWRGHPFIGIVNPTDTIYIDSKFNYCLSDSVEGVNYPYPVISTFMNSDNLLPTGVGGIILDDDEFTIDDDVAEIIATDHTITLDVPIKVENLKEITLKPTITPSTTDGKVHLFIDGVDVEKTEAPFNFTHTFTDVGTYHIQAVYVGDDDDNIAFSPVYDIIVEAPVITNPTKDPAPPQVTGHYALKILNPPSKFTYRDGYTLNMQLTKGNTPVKGVVLERVMPSGATWTATTNAQGIVSIVNDRTEYIPGNHQWGARFYDPSDNDKDKKLIYESLKWIKIEQATPTFTHNASSNKIKKGTKVTFKLNGVDAKKDKNKAGLSGKKITYKTSNGMKGTVKTDSNGKFSLNFNTTGTIKVSLSFAGSVRYKGISKSFNIKVVK